MLVLARKLNEKIRINDDIVLTVVEFRNGVVRLGIDAPKDIKIYREEIYPGISRAECFDPIPTLSAPEGIAE